MAFSNFMDRFANTVVIGVLLAGLPFAVINFLAH